MEETPRGLTRREALKRGAIVAGALWAAPVVQAVGMRPAYAQTTSPAWTNCVAYCIKWIVNRNYIDGSKWGNEWNPLGIHSGTVLSCPEGADDVVPEVASDIVVTSSTDPSESFVVQLPRTCRLYGQDPSPDEFSPYGAAAQCQGSSVAVEPDDVTYEFGETVHIPACVGSEVLHIELIIQCCQNVE